MAKRRTILTVFLASPSDVATERKIVSDVITELNIGVGRALDIQLELITWEDYAQPGLGQDAQDVINRTVPSDYDFFIGIMWHRYGTPTGRAGSGTQEEFDTAKARFDEDPRSVRLLIYFKDAPISPSEIDPDQLSSVREFRSELGKQGLYFTFETQAEFERLVRIHLTRELNLYINQPRQGDNPGEYNNRCIAMGLDIEDNDDEDYGYMDYIIEFEENLEIFLNITSELSDSMNHFSTNISNKTLQLNELQTSMNAQNSKIAEVMRAAAAEMALYSDEAEVKIPQSTNAFNNAIAAHTKAIGLLSVTSDEDEAALLHHISQTSNLKQSMLDTIDSLESFRTAVAETARAIKEINIEKRRLVKNLDYYVSELRSGLNLLIEMEKASIGILTARHRN